MGTSAFPFVFELVTFRGESIDNVEGQLQSYLVARGKPKSMRKHWEFEGGALGATGRVLAMWRQCRRARYKAMSTVRHWFFF